MAANTELQLIPVVRPDPPMAVIVTDDLRDGFHWTAMRGDVVWAMGWTRGRDAKRAELHARNCAAAAYTDHILHPEERK